MKVDERTNLEKENMTGENHTGNANRPVQFLTASSIIGDKIYNHLDEDLGSIKEIMLDVSNGTVEYVVLEYGGFIGMGSKFFAIPFGALEIDTKRHAFIFRQSKDVLEKAPGFDKDHWPETNAHLNKSSEYWGGFMGSNTGSEPY
ncbi:MAG: PRC-barrel domain-containing protein [Bacteroidota bacterium]